MLNIQYKVDDLYKKKKGLETMRQRMKSDLRNLFATIFEQQQS